MSAPQDGGPAFPVPGCTEHIDHTSIQHEPYPGMTLRDWFAGQAIAGICAHPDTWGCDITEIPAMAYKVADSALAASSKEGCQ